MSALTIRDVSRKTIDTIKSRAYRNHRSLNGEILYLMEYIASFGDHFEFTVTPPENPEAEKQKETILALAGKWPNDRSDDEIIADIEGSRTFGRKVYL